jgi:hypothetical protein
MDAPGIGATAGSEHAASIAAAADIRVKRARSIELPLGLSGYETFA